MPITHPVPVPEAEESALHDEMLDGLVAAVASHTIANFATCPAWCATDHSTDEDPNGRVHVRVVGSQHLELTASEWHGQIGQPTVYLPIGDCGLTPDEALDLAACLTLAVGKLSIGHHGDLRNVAGNR